MLLPEESQDVNSESTETNVASSDSETAESQADGGQAEEAQAPDTTAPNKTGTVPYEKFSQSREEIRALKQELEELKTKVTTPEKPAESNPQEAVVKEQLKKLGFVSQEEVDTRLKQMREDELVERELSRLETRYDGKDGSPKFNRKDVVEYAIENRISSAEAAYKLLHEKELIDWHIAQAAGKSKGVKSEASDGSGSAQVGTTNDDLKYAIAQGDKGALRTFLKRLNSR